MATSRPTPRGDRSKRSDDSRIDGLVAPELGALDPAQRRAVADHWRQIAAKAQASVARWTRFSLQLLALGAPAALLTGTEGAAQDATDHARFASALAGGVSGRRLVTPSIDANDVGATTDLRAFVHDLVEEGCVRGTLDVVEAMTRAEKAHPGVRDAFGQIASDQAEHAALAWASLAWIVETRGTEVGESVIAAIDHAVDAAIGATERAGVSVPDLGVLSGVDKSDARHRALDEVVAPLRDEIARRAQGEAA